MKHNLTRRHVTIYGFYVKFYTHIERGEKKKKKRVQERRGEAGLKRKEGHECRVVLKRIQIKTIKKKLKAVLLLPSFDVAPKIVFN